MMKLVPILIAATATAAAVAVSPVAAAAPPFRSVAVEAGDLDLQSDKGLRILALRIQRAARGLCATEAVGSLPRNLRRERRCIKHAQDSAAAGVKVLTAAGAAPAGQGG